MDNNSFFDDRPVSNRTRGSRSGTAHAYDYYTKNRTGSRGQRPSGRKGPSKKNKLPIGWLIVIDVVIAALLILAFYVFDYVLPRDMSSQAVELPHASASADVVPSETATAGAEQTAAVTDPAAAAASAPPTVSAAPVDPSAWGAKFPDKFSTGEVLQTDTSYQSANINVTVNKTQTDTVTYYVADIYIKDLKYLKSAFAEGKFGSGYHEATDTIAQANNAIIAINGDYCGNNAGPVVRNGELYRDEEMEDVMVMFDDGSMQTYTAEQFDLAALTPQGLYQVWTFGPMLLNDGAAMTEFNSTLGRANPRTAIGYFEPGHYCFVVVDGRQPGYSEGYTLTELSQLFADLGCKAAFNLDGGQSSEMAFMGEFANQPYNGGRSTSDIIYISEE